jgi:hypothetical protein
VNERPLNKIDGAIAIYCTDVDYRNGTEWQMPRNTTTIDILLASPSDVDQERKLVIDRAEKWNIRRGARTSVYFNVLRWEDNVSAGFGAEPQEVVTRNLGLNYDAVIAIFWNRVGTKTASSVSGSVEEYEHALERYKQGEKVEISFYFKRSPVDPDTIDPAQLQSVRDLKARVGPDGGIYKEFDTLDKLSAEVDLLLDNLAARLGESKEQIPSVLAVQGDTESNTSQPNTDHKDRGLIDVQEEMEERTNELTHIATEIANHLSELGEASVTATSEMEQAKDASGIIMPKLAKPIIHKLTQKMDQFSEFAEVSTPKLLELTLLFIDDTRALIDISKDFDNSDDDASAAVLGISELHSTFITVAGQMADLQATVDGLQRMSKEFNIAKRRLSKNLDNLSVGLVNSANLLEPSLRELTEIAQKQLQTHSVDTIPSIFLNPSSDRAE